jgi:hypothetical protein
MITRASLTIGMCIITGAHFFNRPYQPRKHQTLPMLLDCPMSSVESGEKCVEMAAADDSRL